MVRLNKKWFAENVVELIVLAIISYIAFFYQLGTAPVYMWDEGVYATNALEMLLRGDWLVKYFDNHPEMWATQPPLVAWIHTLFLSVFGISETVLRLPSALAATSLVFFLYFFIKKEFGNKNWGLFSAIILALSQGFTTYHIARTADLDIFVTLFANLYAFYFYKLYGNGFKSQRLTALFVVFVFCAFFSKTVAGLFFLPVIFVFLISTKNLSNFFRNKYFYYYAIPALVVVIFYYTYREIVNPGYIETASRNEFIGRFTGNIPDNHQGPITFYWDKLINDGFIPWLYLLPLSLFILIRTQDKNIRKFILYLSSLILFTYFVLTLSSTKLMWYDAQLYSFLSIIAAFPLSFLYNKTLESIQLKKSYEKIFLIFFVVALFLYNIQKIERKHINDSRNLHRELLYGWALKDIKEKYPEIKNIRLIPVGYYPNVVYYRTYYNRFLGYSIDCIEMEKKIEINENSYILYAHPLITDTLMKRYEFEILEEYDEMKFVKVGRRIPPVNYYNEIIPFANNKAVQNAEQLDKSVVVNKNNEFSASLLCSYRELKEKSIKKIKVKADLFSENIEKSGYFVISGNKNYWFGIELKNFLESNNKLYHFYTELPLPALNSKEEQLLKFYFWNNSEYQLRIAGFSVEFVK